MTDPELLVTRADGVVEVVFNRPHRHNAFTEAMYGDLHGLCDELVDDPTTRVVVLRGAGGRAFAAATRSPTSSARTRWPTRSGSATCSASCSSCRR